MIDYTHIPMHIRCTERYKIDPAYPGGRKFWALAEKSGRQGMDPGAMSSGSSERQRRALEIIREHGEISASDLSAKMGVSVETLYTIVNGITHSSPIYQEQEIEHGALTFGILGVAR